MYFAYVRTFALGVVGSLGITGLVLGGCSSSTKPVPEQVGSSSDRLVAFVGLFLHQMLQVHGLGHTTATRTGWLIGVIPIWTAVLSAVMLGERFGLQKIGGLAVGTLGVILLVTRGDLAFASLDAGTLRGDLLVLGSTVTWAVYTVTGRAVLDRPRRYHHPQRPICRRYAPPGCDDGRAGLCEGRR